MVSDWPAARRVRRSPRLHFYDPMPRFGAPCRPGHGTIAPGTFDAERLDRSVYLGPRDQGLIPTRIGHRTIDRRGGSPRCRPPRPRGRVYGYRRRLITFRAAGCLVTLLITISLLGFAARWLARVGGTRTVTSGDGGPYWVTAHPVSWRPYDVAGGNDRQIRSEDHRSVNLRVRPPLTGTQQCHRADPVRQENDAHSQVNESGPE